MSEPADVPRHVDYRRCAAQGRTIEGTIPLVSMPRAVAETHRAPGNDVLVHVQLAFSEDAQRRVHATGRVSAPLVLQCKRCGAAFEQVIEAGVAGVVVTNDDAAAALPRADEPIVTDGDMLDVPALAEDELLLALPMVARCDNARCRARYESDAPGGEPRSPAREDNPFAVLGQLNDDDETH